MSLPKKYLVMAVVVGMFGALSVVIGTEKVELCGKHMSCPEEWSECSYDAHDFSRDACYDHGFFV